jgi:hypothetical protein
MFGATLALKGAFDEQREGRPPHCEDGCYHCYLEALYIFERWVLAERRERARISYRIALARRLFGPVIRKERHR